MSVALRSALEDLVVRSTGARVVRACRRCGSASHGQPRLLGSSLHLSLSYAGGLAVAAWSAHPIGIDVERGTASSWTLTEAVLKATGAGLTDYPDVDLPPLWTAPLDLPASWVGTVALDVPPSLPPTFEWRFVT